MILDYDCASVAIRLITFLEGPRDHPCGVQVAICEADPIVVCPSGNVVMCDHAAPEHTTDCAIDSEHFLDALSAMAVSIYEKVWRKAVKPSPAALCAQKAGGEKYETFFRMLGGSLG